MRIDQLILLTLLLSSDAFAIRADLDCVEQMLAALRKPILITDDYLNTVFAPETSVTHELSRSNAQPQITGYGRIALAKQKDSAARVRTAINEMKVEKPIRTLIYGASGFDSATPFLTIPTLSHAIGLDSHPFHDAPTNTSVVPTFGPGDQSDGYTLVAHVDATKIISNVLVGRLMLHFPNIRILRVVGIRTSSTPTKAGYDYYPHGAVVFDTGEGTPVRTYMHVHVQSQKSNWVEISSPDVMIRKISAIPFDAILRKGSQLFFHQDEPIAFPLIKALTENGGLWLMAIKKHRKM